MKKDPHVPTIHVSFVVQGRPDEQGLRIRSVSPTGIYISSRNPEAAKWYFETAVGDLLLKQKIIELAPGEALGYYSRIDWNKALEEGGATIAMQKMSRAETREVTKDASPMIMPPVASLSVSWFANASGDSFCLITDDRNMVDSWIVDAVTADLPIPKNVSLQ